MQLTLYHKLEKKHLVNCIYGLREAQILSLPLS